MSEERPLTLAALSLIALPALMADPLPSASMSPREGKKVSPGFFKLTHISLVNCVISDSQG